MKRPFTDLSHAKRSIPPLSLMAHSLIWIWIALSMDTMAIVDPSFRTSQLSTELFIFSSLALLGTAAAFALLSDKLGNICDRTIIVASCPLTTSFGMLFISLGANQWLNEQVLIVAGSLLVGYGTTVATLLWGELFATLKKTWIEKLVLWQSAIIAVLNLVINHNYTADFLSGLLLPIICVGALLLARRNPRKHSLENQEMLKRRTAPPASLIVGFSLVCAGIGFLEMLVAASPEIGQTSLYSNIAHWVTFAAIILLVVFARDTSYIVHVNVILSLLVLGFLIMPITKSENIGWCIVIVQTAHYVLEGAAWLAVSDVASYSTSSPVKLFGWTRVIISGGSLAGMIIGSIVLSLFPSPLPDVAINTIVLVVVFSFAIAAIWLLNERTLNQFMWGNAEATDAPREMSADPVDAITRKHGLTQRESEILALLVKGRSVPFIEEELVISGNTVNSHIKHIYQKCNVHSRQELLTLVESGRWGGEGH